MADFKTYFDKMLKWEGGWADDPADRGGKTNMGVTIKVWKAWAQRLFGIPGNEQTLRAATKQQISTICKVLYWDVVRGDNIANQKIAQHVADFGWGSGPITAIKRIQAVLKVTVDGKIGPKTIAAINNHPNPAELLNKLVADRIAFLDAIIKRDPTQRRFEKGWKNRVYDIVK